MENIFRWLTYRSLTCSKVLCFERNRNYLAALRIHSTKDIARASWRRPPASNIGHEFFGRIPRTIRSFSHILLCQLLWKKRKKN